MFISLICLECISNKIWDRGQIYSFSVASWSQVPFADYFLPTDLKCCLYHLLFFLCVWVNFPLGHMQLQYYFNPYGFIFLHVSHKNRLNVPTVHSFQVSKLSSRKALGVIIGDNLPLPKEQANQHMATKVQKTFFFLIWSLSSEKPLSEAFNKVGYVSIT